MTQPNPLTNPGAAPAVASAADRLLGLASAYDRDALSDTVFRAAVWLVVRPAIESGQWRGIAAILAHDAVFGAAWWFRTCGFLLLDKTGE